MTLGHFGTGSRRYLQHSDLDDRESFDPRHIRPQEAAQSPCTAQRRRPDPWRLAHTPRASVGQIGSPSGAEEVLSGQAGLAQPLCSTHSQREATVVTTRLFKDGTTLSSSSRFEMSALRRPPALSRCSDIWIGNRARTGRNRSTAGIVAGGDDLPQLSLSATVSIRLRATEIRRCQAPWRRPPQSPSRGCLRGLWPPAWRPLDGWRRRRGHHG